MSGAHFFDMDDLNAKHRDYIMEAQRVKEEQADADVMVIKMQIAENINMRACRAALEAKYIEDGRFFTRSEGTPHECTTAISGFKKQELSKPNLARKTLKQEGIRVWVDCTERPPYNCGYNVTIQGKYFQKQ